MKLSRISWIIIIVMFTVLISIVYLYKFLKIDPNRYGPIGDSIGGILGPFVSLITIIFIYETFLTERRKSKLETENLKLNF